MLDPDKDHHDVPSVTGESVRDLLIEQNMSVREIRNELRRANDQLLSLVHWKTGGQDAETGVDVRLDRLERAMATYTKMGWIVTSSVIGLVLETAWDLVTRAGVK